MTRSVVFGAGGFIGSHLVKYLREQGQYVIGVDRHEPRFMECYANEFHTCDIRSSQSLLHAIPDSVDYVYQLSAFLGGALIIDGGTMDADIFMNNMAINISVLSFCKQRNVQRIFFTSSACVYKDTSFEIEPVNTYGWEKYAAEKLYEAFSRQYNVPVRIGRLFNVYGPRQEFQGGRERVISALCRKVYQSNDGTLSILGNGLANRSFLYIDDAVRAIQCVLSSDCSRPVNIGSDSLVTIKDLARLICNHANKDLVFQYTDSSDRVSTRACETTLLRSLGWSEQVSLVEGLGRTYDWIAKSCETIS